MIYGFTGCRKIYRADHETIDNVLDSLVLSGVVTGACVGVDAYIGFQLYKKHPKINHTAVIPNNYSRVDPWWEKFEPEADVHLVYMTDGSTYKDRNQEIINKSDRIIGFPEYPENHPNSMRSGTWQTLRMARRVGKLDRVVVLRGE